MKKIIIIITVMFAAAMMSQAFAAGEKTCGASKTEKAECVKKCCDKEGKDCDCGCKDGKECTCKDKCACDCGCKDGKKCECKGKCAAKCCGKDGVKCDSMKMKKCSDKAKKACAAK